MPKVCARLLAEFAKKKAVLAYSVFRDFEKENTYSVVGEWKARKAMETHFKTLNIEVLIGATRVLAETFEIRINETLEKGDFKLAKEKISLLANKEQVDRKVVFT